MRNSKGDLNIGELGKFNDEELRSMHGQISAALRASGEPSAECTGALEVTMGERTMHANSIRSNRHKLREALSVSTRLDIHRRAICPTVEVRPSVPRLND